MSEIVITIKGAVTELSGPEDIIGSIQNFLDLNEAAIFIAGSKYEVSIKPAVWKTDHIVALKVEEPEEDDEEDDEDNTLIMN